MTPAEKYRALIASAGPAAELGRIMQDATRESLFAMFKPDVAAQMWNKWLAEHAGMSLLALLRPDGTVAACEELPTADAERFVTEHDDAVIIATWGA